MEIMRQGKGKSYHDVILKVVCAAQEKEEGKQHTDIVVNEGILFSPLKMQDSGIIITVLGRANKLKDS